MTLLVCKHGNPAGVTIEPAEFYKDGHEAGKDHIIQRITMPVCDQCLLEAVGLADGECVDQEKMK